MQIIIPTYGRSDKLATYRHLPKKLQAKTILVVQHREKHLYKEFHPTQLLVLPNSIQTITPTRQYIMKWAHKKGLRKIVMLDDDLRFDIRRMDEAGKFYVATDAQVEVLFKKIEKALDQYAHVGVLSREGGNRVEESYKEATRMMRVLAYRVDIFTKLKIKFDRLPLQEDFDVTLQLLRKGFPNYVICDYVNGQGTSGAKGGCSHFRTIELHNENVKKLAALHAPFVKIVEKQTKGAWGGQARLDVMVQWKKAYESSRR